MEVIRGFKALNKKLNRPVVTIGNFDGVHLGHRKIIATAVEKAKEKKGVAIAYTFRPHPQVALRPESVVRLLSTYDEKIEILSTLGLDFVIEEPFGRDFSSISPREFFDDVILKRIQAESIVVGYDFAFGKERRGHLDLLKSFCDGTGIELSIVSPQSIEGEIVSSSKIRQYLLNANLPAANRLLGRPFFYRGIVTRGEGRGRKIGFPTANLSLGEKLALPYGVYATLAWVDGKKYPSVTNVGVRPTFQTADLKFPAIVETHILGSTLDLYGKNLEVHFIQRIREERKFSGVDELKAQIKKDADQALSVISN